MVVDSRFLSLAQKLMFRSFLLSSVVTEPQSPSLTIQRRIQTSTQSPSSQRPHSGESESSAGISGKIQRGQKWKIATRGHLREKPN